MKRNIWLISDTHFNHSNILKFTGKTGEYIRPGFSDVYDMNKTMIDRWNSVVQPSDKVYHLGDVFMGAIDDFMPIWKQLQGHKRLIVGNHDNIKFLSTIFDKVQLIRFFPEYGAILSHIPLHTGSLNNLVNVHGHIHEKSMNDPRYMNVSVEAVNYTPVNIKGLCK